VKLTGARVEAFLRKPDPAVVAVLFYGPDQGLIRERADMLVATVAGDASDPFRVGEVSVDAIKEDRARLLDEASALPFSGGRRVVRIRDGKDVLTAAVGNLLDGAAGGGLVVIEAGELAPRSTLRQALEKADRAAAIACYLDDADSLKRVIAEELGRHGITASAEAADLLAAYLGADRRLTRSELEKLALYRGAPGRIEFEDVMAVIGDAGAVTLDAIVAAACDGDLTKLDRGLQTAAGEGVSAIALLRAMARYLQRLVQARAAMAAGRDVSQALAAVRPAVFYQLQPQFRRQMQLWRPELLATALTLVAETELACKRTGAPQDLLCQRVFFRLAGIVRATTRNR
jgi:DNA polymerase-3 subunit delta